MCIWKRAHRRRLERGGPFQKNLEADLTKMLPVKKCTNQGFLLAQGGALDPPNNQHYLQLAAVSPCLCHSKMDADWFLDPKTD